MNIPIANIYYLLAYAWDSLDEANLISIDLDDFKTNPELLAGVLESGVTHLLKRGLNQSYITHEIESPMPHGKILIDETIKRGLIAKGKLQTAFDNLNHDVLENRIIKATLRDLALVTELNQDHRRRLKKLCESLKDVSEAKLRSVDFRNIVFHRNNRISRFLINTCKLIFDSLQPHEVFGPLCFRDFVRDEQKMPILFERFVRNFYRREQAQYRVSAPWIKWSNLKASKYDIQFLPQMKTDIVLRNESRTIIVDTKYYKYALRSSNRTNKPKVNSQHLYQLFTYLRNIPNNKEHHPEGILIYPTVQTSLDLNYNMNGYRMRICTVNLNEDWRSIKNRLLGLLEPWDVVC